MAWIPLRRLDPREINPEMAKKYSQFDITPDDEVWWNPTYQVVVRYLVPMEVEDVEKEVGPNGMLHFSIHRHDRAPIRDWRHLQQMKNEVAGEDRWALEVYPPEDKLVDTSNEYHMYVLPKGMDLPFAFQERAVVSDRQGELYSEDPSHRGKQEPWEEGLTTGHGRNDNPDPRFDAILGIKSNEADIPKGKLKGISGT